MTTTTKTNSDTMIAENVTAELFFDPQITTSEISAKVHEGRVTLSGIADSYATKWEADHAAFRVSGVRSVDNIITVDPKKLGLSTDAELSTAIHAALNQDASIPTGHVMVSVFDGDVTLSGSVNWYFQRDAAEKAASNVRGIRSVKSQILITPPKVSATAISEDIQNALIRSAQVDSKHIKVKVEDSTVTLTGNVRSSTERSEAVNATWRAKGVSEVMNEITITAY